MVQRYGLTKIYANNRCYKTIKNTLQTVYEQYMGETKQRKEGKKQAQRAKMDIGKRRGARTTDTHFFKFKEKNLHISLIILTFAPQNLSHPC